MSRYYMDCRETPNEAGCTLKISGEQAELFEAAVQHAVSVHSEKDTPEFREGLKAALKPELETEPTDTQRIGERAAMLM